MHYMKKQFLRNVIYLYYILNHMIRMYHSTTAFIDDERDVSSHFPVIYATCMQPQNVSSDY